MSLMTVLSTTMKIMCTILMKLDGCILKSLISREIEGNKT